MSQSKEIAIGSIVKLRHVATQKLLRSLSRPYAHASGSKQQMVVATSAETPETYWIVKPSHETTDTSSRPVKHGTTVTLEHWTTRKNLHSHKPFPAPVTTSQQEVTAYGENGKGDANDNWKVEIESGGDWVVGQQIRLIHAETDAALHSHYPDAKHTPLTAGEQEVTAFPTRNADDFWTGELVVIAPPTIDISEYPADIAKNLALIQQSTNEYIESLEDMKRLVSASVTTFQDSLAAVQSRTVEAEELKAGIVAYRTELAGMVEDTSTWAGDTLANSKQTEELKAQAIGSLETIKGGVATATESASRLEAIKAKAEQTQAVIAEKSAHIEDGRRHVDSVRNELDSSLTAAKQSAVNAEAESKACRAFLERCEAIHGSAQTVKATMDAIAESVANVRTAIDGHMATIRPLVDLAETTKQRISEYETNLSTAMEECTTQRLLIDQLLLGATNAGLASAFDNRKATFRRPIIFWHTAFIISLIAIFVMAFIFSPSSEAPGWSDLVRQLLHRLPFILPLIWLAIHSARQATLAKRMEEEYAFKATTSMSFEGYRRQMAEIGKDVPPDSPLAKLCTNTLQTIAEPPGKAYNKRRWDPTPATAAAEVAEPIANAVAKALDKSTKV